MGTVWQVSAVLGLLILVLLTGCSAPASQDSGQLSRYAAGNASYSQFGFSLEYPNNLALIEHGALGEKSANWDNGGIELTGTNDYVTVEWRKMHHVPPNIPLLYDTIWSSAKQNPDISNVKIYNLQTYPDTTCGDATFIGRMGYYDKTRAVQSNEGILLWYNATQDRLYYIDITSDDDYHSFIRAQLERFRGSFRCIAF